MRIAQAALLAIASISATLAPLSASAWSLHYLVTDRSMAHESMADLSTAIQTESLDGFLFKERDKVARLFDDYYSWLESKGSKRFKRQKFDVSKPDAREFLKAARLNPKTRFSIVRRILPTGAAQHRELKPAEVEHVLNEKIQFKAQFEDVSGQSVSARSILSTFSDEPDWGMDRGLWEIPEYGYGEIPYGSKTGVSSQAAFHMQFLHENWLVRLFAPEMLDGMAMERADLFARLARLAFETGHPYWGYRFTAWVMHYFQDICQPYHAKAVPHGDWLYYLRFVISPDKEKFKRESTQLVKNRHFAYEDFVANGLLRSYMSKEALYRELAGFLEWDHRIEIEPGLDPMAGVSRFFGHAAGLSADHARKIDEAVTQAFGPKLTSDPQYDLESDPAYSIDQVIERMTTGSQEKILRETKYDFELAAMMSRSLVRLLAPKRP